MKLPAWLGAGALGLSLMIPTPGVAQWPRKVIDRLHFRDVTEVPFEYTRPGDPIVGEMWFLVADDESWCLVSAPEWVMAETGEDWICRWRRPRGL